MYLFVKCYGLVWLLNYCIVIMFNYLHVNLFFQSIVEPYILDTVPSAAAAISNTEELSLICYVVEGYSQPPITLQWWKEEEELSFVTLDNGNTTQLNLLAGRSNCYGEYNCVVRVSPQLEFIKKVLVEEIGMYSLCMYLFFLP